MAAFRDSGAIARYTQASTHPARELVALLLGSNTDAAVSILTFLTASVRERQDVRPSRL
jgi:hypothetical protein